MNNSNKLSNTINMVFNLAYNDFRTRYVASYFGVFWAFVQPVVTVLIYIFVFQVGFRATSVNEYPYVLWLVCGIVPWFFFSESLMNASNAFIEYNFLVKKVVFRIGILPIMKIVSNIFVHIFFVIFMLCIYAFYGNTINIFNVQVIYYSVCTVYLLVGLSILTSSLVVFFRDLGQIISIMLQIILWLTPIMWNFDMIPYKYRLFFKLNPLFYITSGYRDSMLYKVWFIHRYKQTAYFWIISTLILIVGLKLFKKLKPHFSDIL